MRCESCGFDNPVHHRFCGACGTRLVLVCASCLVVSSPRMRFCGVCGERLSGGTAAADRPSPTEAASGGGATLDPPPAVAAAPRSPEVADPPPAPAAPPARPDSGPATEQERRIVSVLFTDMSGSTAMAEKMDPEEFTAIVNELFTELGTCLTRYGGHIDKYIGDAIMATFGAPIAHENDPERAILAALDMQAVVERFAANLERRTGVTLRMRVGINTGEVIAGQVGSEARADYTVMGDTVNTASRLEHHAPLGGVLVSESTYRATRGLFEWRVLDPITVKGKSEPLAVYQPLARAKSGAQRGVRGIAWTDTPFVGRQKLVEAIGDTYEMVCRGEPAVVAAVGEAGIGKTRLRHEFTVEARRRGGANEALILVGRSLPYTQGTSYGAVITLLRGYFDLGDDMTHEQIAARLAERGLGAEGADALMPLLTGRPAAGSVAGLTPEQWQRLVFATIRDLIEREASSSPVVLFFEDLHWIDPSSLDVLTFLIKNLRRVPVLFFLLYRPDLEESPVWTTHPTFVRHEIKPLTPDQSRSLIAAILPGLELPADVVDRIVSRSSGNPFYLEEILKSFHASGAIRREGDGWVASEAIEQFVVPDSVQALLRARVDALDGTGKRVLQQAAVLGRTVRKSILDAVSEVHPLEPPLERLAQVEFLLPSATDADAHEFKTVLAQEVAYSTMLVRRRRAYHQRVAEVLEQLGPEFVERHVDEVARHYFQGEIWPRALATGRRAGDRARSLFANSEAIEHYRRCLIALDRLETLLGSEWGEQPRPPGLAEMNREQLVVERVEILIALADVQALTGRYDEALATYQSALERATRPATRAQIYVRMAESVHDRRAKWQEGLDCLTAAAEEMSRGDGDLVIEAQRDVALSRTYWRLSRLDEARTVAESCLARLEGTPHHVERARALRQLGSLAYATSDFEAARGWWERGLEVARLTGDAREVGPFLQNLGVAAFRLGERERAEALFQEFLALNESTGDVFLQAMALASLGGCAKARGDLDTAIALYERSARMKDRLGDPRGIVIAYHNIAEVQGERGDRVGAIETLDRALTIARDVGARDTSAAILRQIAEHRLELGDLDGARAAAQEGISLAGEVNLRLEMVLGARVLGRLAAREGRHDEAASQLAEVVEGLRGLKNSPELGATLLDLAAAELARGRAPQARELLAECEPLVAASSSAADRARLAELRAALRSEEPAVPTE